MCGIYGYSGHGDPSLIDEMATAQQHRGPDDCGAEYFADQLTTIGMRRLAIVDIEGGHQPMSGASGQCWVTFNGEIFNAQELRSEFLSEVAFRSKHSDTEVLINMYERFGPECVRHLNGMFAFVILDLKRNILFGARDPFGIKPLFYHADRRIFSFSSELKSLLTLPWISCEIDATAVSDYLACQTIPAPRTIYKTIKKLAAGERFYYDLRSRQLKIETYWRPSFQENALTDRGAACELVRDGFMAAVKRWSQSDVPIACSLSGGIDSSAVVGALATTSQVRLKTFSLGFNDAPELDERDQARAVAERWQTEHQELVISDSDLLQELPAMIHALDEPYAGGLPSWWVFKGMAEQVKVGMTGSGGDELFSNYGKYEKFEQPGNRFRRSLGFIKRGGKMTTLLRHPFGALHYSYFPDGARASLFAREFRSQVETSFEGALSKQVKTAKADNVRNQIAFVDMRLQLPEEFLFMTDRFSMAHSLEARTPFLDREFVDAVLQINPMVRVDRKKSLFTEALGDLIPTQVLGGQKRGFVLPYGRWLRAELRDEVEELFSERYLREQGIWSPSIRSRFVMPHLSGRRDCSWQLWTLLMFQLWHAHALAR